MQTFPFVLKTGILLDLSWVTYQETIAMKPCGLLPQMASSKLSKKVKVTVVLTTLAQMLAKLPNILNSSLATLVRLGYLSCSSDQTAQYFKLYMGRPKIWTNLCDKTKLCSCQSQTASFLYQIFQNLFCSYKLTEYLESGNIWLLTLLIAKVMNAPDLRNYRLHSDLDFESPWIFYLTW